MKKLALLAWACAATIFAVIAGASSPVTTVKTVLKPVSVGQETLYIRNFDQEDVSDAWVVKNIPAWEIAVNRDFASYWHTTRFHLVFIGRHEAPTGSMSAVFVKKGPIKGALAYHTVGGNAPAITVYAGTGKYYGYDNSVSFTHELFELAADPVTSYLNIGYPSDYVWLQKPSGDLKQTYSSAIGWFSEACDPVEADSYLIGKTRISDFVSPAWFNDGIGQRFDFMGLAQQPYWIRPGGYAVFYGPQGFSQITNFRKGHPEDRGFYVSDRQTHD